MKKIFSFIIIILISFNISGCNKLKDKFTMSQPNAKVISIRESNLEDINMITQTMGWGLSHEGILKTMDGGKSWSNITPVKTFVFKNKGDFNKSIVNIENKFFNEKEATSVYLKGNNMFLYTTLNSGESWSETKFNLGKQFISDCNVKVDIVNKDKVFLLLTDNNNRQYVYKNNGVNKEMELINKELDSNVYIKYIKFIDDYHGICIGKNKTTGHEDLYFTDDGGVRWEKKRFNLDNKQIYKPKVYKDTIYVPIKYTEDKKNIVAVYKSENKGHDWILTMPIEMKTPVKFIYDIDKNGVFWITDSYGNKIYKLRNKGEYIQEIYSEKNLLDKKLDFIDANTGFLLDNNKLYITRDRGITWALLNI